MTVTSQQNGGTLKSKHTAVLASSFRNLYTERTLRIVLDCLEQTWDNKESEAIIKSKVLFSIIVVSASPPSGHKFSADLASLLRYGSERQQVVLIMNELLTKRDVTEQFANSQS